MIYLALQASKMKKNKFTYRHLILFALVFTMLGALCYSPILKSQSKSIISSKENKKSEKGSTSEHFITIDHHLANSISFSFDANANWFFSTFEKIHFALPFEFEHEVISAIFQNSYLKNIFPFAISAQAP
jgi:hypothetical protein